MSELVLGLGAGAVLGALWWVVARGAVDVEVLQRANHRGRSVPTGAGLVVPLAVLTASAGVAVGEVATSTPLGEWADLTTAALVVTAGFGLLGLFDDVAGVGQSGGFRGHLRALGTGRLTSGSVKLLGGAAIGLVVAASIPAAPPPTNTALAVLAVLRDGAVIALAANLVNLFDRRPGRAVKVATVGFLAAATVSRSVVLTLPALGVGAGLGVLWADLRERCMIGDAGANALGGLCGLALLVAAPSGGARWIALVSLVGLNAASELVSFSRVIDAVAPLRWVDRLGTVRHD